MFGLGDVLRKLRDQRKWSLDDLAGKSGVNRQSISEIERGVVDPRRSTLDRLAVALGYADIASLESANQPGPIRGRDQGRHTLRGSTDASKEDGPDVEARILELEAEVRRLEEELSGAYETLRTLGDSATGALARRKTGSSGSDRPKGRGSR